MRRAAGKRAATSTALVALFVGLGVACAFAPRAEAGTNDAAGTALHALIQRAWDREMREHPVEASLDGFHQYDARWPDVSLAAIAREHQEDEATLADLAKIDRGSLSDADRINYDLFKYRYERWVNAYPFHGYLMPLNQLDGIQLSSSLTRTLRFDSAADYANFVKRLQSFGTYMDQTIALLREGLREEITEPHVVMRRIPHQIAAQIVSSAEKSRFYDPFRKMPDTIPAAEQAGLRKGAAAAITKDVVPAFERMQKFFNDDYLPHCRTTTGASDLPNGHAYYALLVRQATTTQMTPKQVHEFGLEKVKQVKAEMEKVFRKIGFKGSYQGFLHTLRTDPRFYYKNPKDLLEAYQAAAKRVDPHLVDFISIRLLPRVPYGVRPIPAALAPDTYPAYSVPPSGDGSVAGYVEVNLYKPESRPKYEIQVLMCHEGRPGHQLQIPIAMELKGIPQFRRFDYYSAYGEGWALYSETLCNEMGLYDNPYSRFGYLDYQMWRAVRLVVDTGLHEYGWSRARAIRYFEDHTALSEQNIETEVDRYIAWPGQALSYMVGEIRIQNLRKKAEQALGSHFDLREFHDVVLENGAIPLDELSKLVDRWIAVQKAKITKSASARTPRERSASR